MEEEASAAALRRRTGALERENRALREEATRLAEGTDAAELTERELIRDIATQLGTYWRGNRGSRSCKWFHPYFFIQRYAVTI